MASTACFVCRTFSSKVSVDPSKPIISYPALAASSALASECAWSPFRKIGKSYSSRMLLTTAAAWRTKRSYAILTTRDVAANPDLQRWMYKRSGAKVTTVASSHAVYISHPKIVARVIEEAASSTAHTAEK